MAMLVAVLVLAGCLAFCALSILMAVKIASPPRFNDGMAVYHLHRLSPGDLRMVFENVSFSVRDEQTGSHLNIAGWWIPHPDGSSRTMVLLHDYSSGKVVAISIAPLLQELGWNVLAIDSRGHGDSSGNYCTGGIAEIQDVDQVIDQLLNQHIVQCETVGIFGIGFGAFVGLKILHSREDVQVGVRMSATDMNHTVRLYAQRQGWPTGVMLRFAKQIAEWISGRKWASANEVESKKRVLSLRGEDDLEANLRKFLSID